MREDGSSGGPLRAGGISLPAAETPSQILLENRGPTLWPGRHWRHLWMLLPVLEASLQEKTPTYCAYRFGMGMGFVCHCKHVYLWCIVAMAILLSLPSCDVLLYLFF